MVHYFLHRVPPEVSQIDTLDYTSLAASNATVGDLFIVFQSHTHHILGAFELQEKKELKPIAKPQGTVVLKEYLPKLSFVGVFSEQTIRMLKKKDREIELADYELLLRAIQASAVSSKSNN